MAFAALCIGVGCGARSIKEADPPTPLPRDAPLSVPELDEAITAVGDYIQLHTDEDGRFTYVIDGRGKIDPTDYNVLRHGGTIYALGELRRRRGENDRLDAAILRSARYLIQNYLGTFEAPAGIGESGSIAVWSRVGEEIDGDRREAKLGGAGLGLVALTAAHAVNPESVSLANLRGLALTIAAMQKSDGHFVSKVIEGDGPDTRFVSLYYPGEAVLGLARLYRIDPDPRWIQVAGKAIAALIRQRADLDDDELPADHWLLIAIGEISLLADEKPAIASMLPISTEKMREHAVRIADSMVAQQIAVRGGGSFHPKRRSTPSATRLEGILALLAALPKSHSARDRLERSVRAGIRFLLTCRVKDGSALRDGGITRSCPPSRARKRGEIRIDYAQHALSALLGARALGL